MEMVLLDGRGCVKCLSASGGGVAAGACTRVGTTNRGIAVLATCSFAATNVVSTTNVSAVLVNSSTDGIVTKGTSALPVAMSRVVCRTHDITHTYGRTLILYSVPFNDCRIYGRSTLHGTYHVVGRANISTLGLRNNIRVLSAIRTLVGTNVPIYNRLKLAPRDIGGFNNCNVHTGRSTRTRGLVDSTGTLSGTNYFTVILRGIPTGLTTRISHRMGTMAVNVKTNGNYSKRILICTSTLNVARNFGPGFLHRFTRMNRRVRGKMGTCVSTIGDIRCPDTRRDCWSKCTGCPNTFWSITP